jgi:serine/threonine protein kinase
MDMSSQFLDKQVQSLKTLSLNYVGAPYVGLVTYKDGSKVVVKEIPSSGSYESEILRTVKRHPNIVYNLAVVDINQNRDSPLVDAIMPAINPSSKRVAINEFYPGKDLRYFNHRKEAGFRRLIARDVASALAYIHSLRIVHADIKPPNVMFSYNGSYGSAAIIDFNSAVRLGRNAKAKILREPKKTYEPPEQVYDGQVCLSSDIFSLGVLICFMDQGKVPTFGELHLGAEREPLSDHALEELVKDMLDPKPKKRPSAKEVRDTLQSLTKK